MSTSLTVPKGFALSSVFGSSHNGNDELGAGITSSYGVIGYRGKVWSIKYQGKETQLMRDDGDGPRSSIDVVIVKAASAISKIFYKGGYVEGSSSAPDCWSGNGVTPDASAKNKQHPTCAACPMNAWGSRVTESGKQGKQCADSRRIAIVPLLDMANETMGGPMLLRIPAASLKDLKAYGDMMSSYGAPFYGVATRISFDPKEAYPKFTFSCIRALNDQEARQIIEMREDRRVGQVLSEAIEARAELNNELGDTSAPAPAFTPPTAPAPRAEPKAVPTSPFNIAAPAPAAKPTPVVTAEVTQDEPEESQVSKQIDLASFDAMLEDII